MEQTRAIDLVLEGGGVKGIALVGAATALAENGYTFARIGGSSAGAMVGAVMAAMQHAGEPFSRVDEIMRTIDYSAFLDRRKRGAMLGWWPRAADAWGVLFHLGAHPGRHMEQWVRGVLGDLGVRTFGDLYFDDPGSALPQGQSFRLVVTASDLSRQRAMFLPWDLPAHGHDPNEYSVARAVRASAAIPFLFEPVRLKSQYGTLTLADGSLLRSYPIELFDRHDGKPSRWPTLGVRLSSPAGERAKAKPVTSPLSLLTNLIFTTVDSTQVRHVSDPAAIDRSIFAKPRGVRWTDFDLTPEQRASLFDAGHSAATAWVRKHPAGPPAPEPDPDRDLVVPAWRPESME
ncbi:patatin-like phospholipase family protein [Aeromicrobium sp. JJY06]|uniref:patatin-like phospholipase family protein n=1 Tax=Aeromicrobium sp. JJY06 TaxID=3373478 RepID=UPI00376EF706